MNNRSLHEFREAAVAAAGGTSYGQIKDAILARVAALPTPASLIDFGAGRGELLMQLASIFPGCTLNGADYLGRPEGLPDHISWASGDLNEPLQAEPCDLVICSEVIEHLENPRAVFRNLFALTRPGGWLVLSTPNQESLRSYLSLIIEGHFVAFRGPSYPAHITALLRLDLEHICAETGFAAPVFSFTDDGGLPRKPDLTWQKISFGVLKGRFFSDNLIMVTQRPLGE
ncbi:MAG: methyltransferase domain-containing protein [Sphingomonas sp.]|uniref:class I SAM-dependent methyltransferase n=1 Tax=Sphingomonas sp. TaxID=28214 RepID=UPI0035612ABF